MITWVDAIKEYAKQKGGKFVIPKRDSDDYKAIKALQEKMTRMETTTDGKPVKAPKEKPAKKANELPVIQEVKEEAQPRKTTVKPRAKKENVEVAPVVEEVKPEVKVKKERVKKPKTANVPPPPSPEPEPDVKRPRPKVQKKANVEVEPVVEEVKPEVKKARKSSKVEKAEKVVENQKVQEANAKATAKKLLDETRLLIRKEPVVMVFN